MVKTIAVICEAFIPFFVLTAVIGWLEHEFGDRLEVAVWLLFSWYLISLLHFMRINDKYGITPEEGH